MEALFGINSESTTFAKRWKRLDCKLSVARSFPAMTRIGTCLVIVGGEDTNHKVLSSVEVFDWQMLDHVGTKRETIWSRRRYSGVSRGCHWWEQWERIHKKCENHVIPGSGFRRADCGIGTTVRTSQKSWNPVQRSKQTKRLEAAIRELKHAKPLFRVGKDLVGTNVIMKSGQAVVYRGTHVTSNRNGLKQQ